MELLRGIAKILRHLVLMFLKLGLVGEAKVMRRLVRRSRMQGLGKQKK
jgi:hypothetical protein